jgi:hypothetical protein
MFSPQCFHSLKHVDVLVENVIATATTYLSLQKMGTATWVAKAFWLRKDQRFVDRHGGEFGGKTISKQ